MGQKGGYKGKNAGQNADPPAAGGKGGKAPNTGGGGKGKGKGKNRGPLALANHAWDQAADGTADDHDDARDKKTARKGGKGATKGQDILASANANKGLVVNGVVALLGGFLLNSMSISRWLIGSTFGSVTTMGYRLISQFSCRQKVNQLNVSFLPALIFDHTILQWMNVQKCGLPTSRLRYPNPAGLVAIDAMAAAEADNDLRFSPLDMEAINAVMRESAMSQVNEPALSFVDPAIDGNFVAHIPHTGILLMDTQPGVGTGGTMANIINNNFDIDDPADITWIPLDLRIPMGSYDKVMQCYSCTALELFLVVYIYVACYVDQIMTPWLAIYMALCMTRGIPHAQQEWSTFKFGYLVYFLTTTMISDTAWTWLANKLIDEFNNLDAVIDYFNGENHLGGQDPHTALQRRMCVLWGTNFATAYTNALVGEANLSSYVRRPLKSLQPTGNRAITIPVFLDYTPWANLQQTGFGATPSCIHWQSSEDILTAITWLPTCYPDGDNFPAPMDILALFLYSDWDQCEWSNYVQATTMRDVLQTHENCVASSVQSMSNLAPQTGMYGDQMSPQTSLSAGFKASF